MRHRAVHGWGEVKGRPEVTCQKSLPPIKLPLFIHDITRPAPHTVVGYPILPTRLSKLLGTHAGTQTEADDNMDYDQTAKDISLQHI